MGEQLSLETQTGLSSLENSLGRITAALPKLVVKDETDRGAGRVVLADLEETEKDVTRALVSLSVVDKPANNNTLLSNNVNVNGTQSAASNVSVGAAAEAIPSPTIAASAV